MSSNQWHRGQPGPDEVQSGDERRRLAENYAGMADGELLRLAADSESLTEPALDALENEMDRRHLDFPSEEAEPAQAMEMREWVTVRQFRDLPEALLAKGSLESADIECFLGDENLVRLHWFVSNFIGGIKLNVKPEDAENARNLLDQPILEGLYVQGVGLYEQPRCPQCQSLDVNCQEFPVRSSAWRCQRCGAEWADEAAGEPPRQE